MAQPGYDVLPTSHTGKSSAACGTISTVSAALTGRSPMIAATAASVVSPSVTISLLPTIHEMSRVERKGGRHHRVGGVFQAGAGHGLAAGITKNAPRISQVTLMGTVSTATTNSQTWRAKDATPLPSLCGSGSLK